MSGTLFYLPSVLLVAGEVWAQPFTVCKLSLVFCDGIPLLLRFVSFIWVPTDPVSSAMLEWLGWGGLVLGPWGQHLCVTVAFPIFCKNIVVVLYSSFLAPVSFLFIPPSFSFGIH